MVWIHNHGYKQFHTQILPKDEGVADVYIRKSLKLIKNVKLFLNYSLYHSNNSLLSKTVLYHSLHYKEKTHSCLL